ncbi:urease accessory protein UreF [Streptomyces wuyuanensis]|uniref:Urease accessory protein UreF n=1 Tax=Streptomyces wuyuanensis TaxID=1196353 RepID=A0A1G9T7R1_9ACTN|nr:urease accessory UreF family protein [Streptomyces wuyuanensis]SDM43721.1 urease accessory protein [Streptomyces wuyuanensis]
MEHVIDPHTEAVVNGLRPLRSPGRDQGTGPAGDGHAAAGSRRAEEAGPRSGAPARAALLVLADGRFPAGGHAHSGGAEAAVRAGRLGDARDLAEFCRGRLHTTGLTAAGLAAAAAAGLDPLALDAAADARTPSPTLRASARRLGRQLMRAARATWPSPELDALARALPKGAHQPVVLGLTARAAGLGPEDAAHCAVYESVGGPATAAVRLLSLDPFEATAVLARLAPDMDRVAARAVTAAREAAERGTDALPAASAPLLDITAEQHAAWPVRLFAS